jgi:hypothetical protein
LQVGLALLQHVLVSQMQRLSQLPQLAIGQITPGSARDRTELQWANSNASQLQDRIVDRLEHAADNSVAALMQRDSDDRAVFDVLYRLEHRRLCHFAVDQDTTR